MTITGVAGGGQGHAVARIERGKESEHESSGRSRRDDDGIRVDVAAVVVAIVAGDAGAQVRAAESAGVAEVLAVDGGFQGLAGSTRSRRCGLADLHMDDVGAFGFHDGGALHHVHDDEAVDAAAVRRGTGGWRG